MESSCRATRGGKAVGSNASDPSIDSGSKRDFEEPCPFSEGSAGGSAIVDGSSCVAGVVISGGGGVTGGESDIVKRASAAFLVGGRLGLPLMCDLLVVWDG